MSRFDYVKYDEDSQATQKAFKEDFELLEKMVMSSLQPGRAQSLVLTKLEEAYMWVGKAIRDEQIKRNGSAPAQEERKNG